jgi:hypothetical protein
VSRIGTGLSSSIDGDGVRIGKLIDSRFTFWIGLNALPL